MHSEITIALIAGLGAMLGWGLADFFAKVTIDRMGDIASLVWAHIAGTAVLLVTVFISRLYGHDIGLPADLRTWSLLLFFGLLQAAVYLFVYRGFAKGQVAVLNPIFASFTGIVAFVSVVFLGEVASGFVPAILVLIFLGVVLLSADLEALRAKGWHVAHVPGFREVGIATLLAALWTILWKLFVTGEDWLGFALYMYAFMTAGMIVYALITRTKLLPVSGTMWKFLIAIGLCEVVAYASLSLGYSTTPFTSVVALVSGAFSIPTIILAHAFLRERTTVLQRAGMVFVIVGIVLLPLV